MSYAGRAQLGLPIRRAPTDGASRFVGLSGTLPSQAAADASTVLQNSDTQQKFAEAVRRGFVEDTAEGRATFVAWDRADILSAASAGNLWAYDFWAFKNWWNNRSTGLTAQKWADLQAAQGFFTYKHLDPKLTADAAARQWGQSVAPPTPASGTGRMVPVDPTGGGTAAAMPPWQRPEITKTVVPQVVVAKRMPPSTPSGWATLAWRTVTALTDRSGNAFGYDPGGSSPWQSWKGQFLTSRGVLFWEELTPEPAGTFMDYPGLERAVHDNAAGTPPPSGYVETRTPTVAWTAPTPTGGGSALQPVATPNPNQSFSPAGGLTEPPPPVSVDATTSTATGGMGWLIGLGMLGALLRRPR